MPIVVINGIRYDIPANAEVQGNQVVVAAGRLAGEPLGSLEQFRVGPAPAQPPPAPAEPPAPGFEDILDVFRRFEPPGPSPQEQRLLDLQIQSMESSMRLAQEALDRERRRREELDRLLRTTTGTGLDEFEARLSSKSATVALQQLERLEKALRGELPVSPATERAARELREGTRETLRRQLGPGFEVSSPGIEKIARTEQIIKELEEAERRGELAAGAAPAALSQELARGIVGETRAVTIPGLRETIGDLASARLGLGQLALSRTLGLGELMQREAESQREAALGRARIQAALEEARTARRGGRGLGSLIGLIGGTIIGAKLGGPAGALAGASVGGSIFGVDGVR